VAVCWHTVAEAGGLGGTTNGEVDSCDIAATAGGLAVGAGHSRLRAVDHGNHNSDDDIPADYPRYQCQRIQTPVPPRLAEDPSRRCLHDDAGGGNTAAVAEGAGTHHVCIVGAFLGSVDEARVDSSLVAARSTHVDSIHRSWE